MTRINLVTAGGAIFHEGKVLVIKSPSRNAIALPKGRVDPGETIQETAVREVLEETGYKTRVVSELGTHEYDFEQNGQEYHKTVTYFKLELIDESAPQQNLQEGEDFEVMWVSPEEAISLLTYDDAREVLRRAIQ